VSIYLNGMKVASLTDEERSEIRKRQNSECFYCSTVLDRAYVLDHLVPRSKGGAHDHTNRVMACRECDGRKSNRDPTTEELSKQAQLLTL
jgi:5-methylcytosine-specific restriction endonuclease McrA